MGDSGHLNLCSRVSHNWYSSALATFSSTLPLPLESFVLYFEVVLIYLLLVGAQP
jgi:hypothetical protein